MMNICAEQPIVLAGKEGLVEQVQRKLVIAGKAEVLRGPE
jgi:hypothetical protein